MKKITIAIDGHSSCGKSTMAKQLAAKLGYVYVDTGAMYRTVTLYTMRHGMIRLDNTVDTDALQKAMADIKVSFRFNSETQRPDAYLNGECVEKEIRSIEVSSHVSPVAAIPFVRSAMVDMQREMGREKGIVMDGRDIGTTVFPDAELKVFVTASAEVRAQRRYDELRQKGMPADYDDILKNVQERDYIDSHREVSPLRKADDAILLDNSDMTIPEQQAWLEEQVLLAEVNNYLDTLPYERQPESLYEPIKYVLSMGGKRIRPMLMMLAYSLYKDDPESILSTACALETYHNYTLLHDDLMDNADMRRGKETVHKKWDANTAILSGDSMLVLAYQRMAQCGGEHLAEIIDLFTETALEIGEGQQWDMEFESREDVTEEEYIEMIRLKTSVLLACAVKMGAILAGAPKDDQELLYKFGEQMGLAFQLQDDFLDVYGDPKVFGKNIGGDITSNKKTYMLINAMRLAEGETRQELMQWVEAKDFDRSKKVAAVTAIYNKVGIDRMAQDKIEHYFAEARKYLAMVNVPADRKHILEDYTDQMMKRKK